MKKKEEKEMINKDMTIGEVLEKDENLADVFMGFGMHCISCPVSQMETVEEACLVHGVDTDFVLKKLNENVQNKLKNNKYMRDNLPLNQRDIFIDDLISIQ